MTTTLLIVLVVLIVLAAAWAIACYNGLIALKNQFQNAFAQIDVQLQRRYDLIPNLVETAKAYLKHERETLQAVTAARAQAQAAAQQAHANLTPESLQSLTGAESTLAGALSRLFAVVEAYPDLKASENMAQLQSELAATEDHVSFARETYNDAVMRYNTRRETFPDSIVAARMGFKEAALWATEDPVVRQTLRVSFS